jgi:hypothetical protein
MDSDGHRRYDPQQFRDPSCLTVASSTMAPRGALGSSERDPLPDAAASSGP